MWVALVAVGSIAVLAAGPASAIPPEIEISPTTLDFGVVNQGQRSDPQDVVVTNTSGRAIGPVSVDGAVPPAEAQARVFEVDDGCTGLTLQPGASCVLRYTFRPWFVHVSRADLDVQVLEQGQPVGAAFPVTLTGEGVDPLVVSPTVVDFGAVPVGVTSTARLRIANPSAQPFEIVSMAWSSNVDPPFAIDLDPCWGAVLQPGGSCELPVSFQPAAPGPASVSAEIGISATNNNASVRFAYELRGCGATPASACAVEVPPSTTSSSSTTSSTTTTAPTYPPVDATTAPPSSTSVPITAPSTDEPPAVGGGSAGSAGSALPRTGSDPAPLLAGGLALVLAGGALVGVARRRRLAA